jgi:hypothetical protein
MHQGYEVVWTRLGHRASREQFQSISSVKHQVVTLSPGPTGYGKYRRLPCLISTARQLAGWKMEDTVCSTTGTVSRPEHIFIVSESRVRHAEYLSSSAVSRPEKKRLGLRKKSYLCCVPKQLDFGVLKLAPSACWRGLAQPTLQ